MEQGSGKKLWVVVAVLLVLIAGAASAAYYFISSSTVTIDSPSTDFVSASPTSGWWELFFVAGAENLSGGYCPDGGVGGVAWGNGEVRLSVSELGDTAVLNVEDSTIYFSRTLSGNNNLYTSAPMLYTTSGGNGMVWFDFGANTPDTIVGTIHWSGSDDCNGDYPFTMELTQAIPPLPTDPPILLPGQWEITLADVAHFACDPTVVGFTALPIGTVTIEQVTNLDTGQPDPGSILLYNDQNSVSLDVVTDTNVYTQTTDTINLGTPVDSEGDVLLDYIEDGTTFSSDMDIVATSDSTATGTFQITGSDGCTFAVPFTMTAV